MSFLGGLFALFNLDAESNDLVNSDFTIGLPVSWRRGPLSARLRLYHQSSHLGDEFLLNAGPDRVNFSYQALELLVSYELERWRFYGGPEHLFDIDPSGFEPWVLHAGVEYRGLRRHLDLGRVVGGLDLRWPEQNDWDLSASLRAGFELSNPEESRRSVRVMLDAFDGNSPDGQFYDDEVSYLGLGLFLGF